MAGTGSSTSSDQNRSYVTNDGRASTFGRNLIQYIQNRLPYATDGRGENDSLNPKYKFFKKAGMRRAEALAKASVSSSNPYNNIPIGDFAKDSSFGDVMYANIQDDKAGRLRDYRIMAAYSEISDALDEICDEMINPNESGWIADLSYKDIDLTLDEKAEVEKQFHRYIEYYDLKNKGWQYFRQLMVEGEVFFEQIIHEGYVKDGVLGVINLPSEIIDPVYNNIQNMLVKGYIYRKPIFSPSQPNKVEKVEFIPMDQNQIMYVNSGVYNETKNFIIPFLENARRPYRQLSLIEDAIVIYRLVRAPERLVFNVDVGNMPPPKAEAYLKKLIQNYWSRKTFDIDQGDVVKKFNPQSMLDAFWFAKRQGSEGTNVSQLAGGQNLGELSDLMYFIKKLYRALKVPSTRLDPQDQVEASGTSILREELKFARFVIRQQQRFAAGLKKGFITHLTLMGIFEKLELNEQNLEIEFNVPTNFYELRENQRLELKSGNYTNLAGNEFVSATYAQKKYLGWKDKDILANREFLRKDAELQWELSQIQAAGPSWKEQAVAGELGEGEAAVGGEGAGVGGGAGGGIPEFGGGPADTGEADTEEVAETEVEVEEPAEV
tara:strand:+ start:15086 stop:16900 length:1815 start_codon:yes stop_codon:yes gene_type:complete